jgi:DNA modification methylase
VAVFREVRRVLRDDGTLWLNLGDSYAANGRYDAKYEAANPGRAAINGGGRELAKVGAAPRKGIRGEDIKAKDLIGIPWLVAFALRADGWWLRQDIIWAKPNPMPESVRDRCTKTHEYVFLLSKRDRYHCDMEAIAEPAVMTPQRRHVASSLRVGVPGQPDDAGQKRTRDTPEREYDDRNKRSVWTINPRPYAGAHFAVMPEELAETCIRAGCPEGGTVLDPFAGSGTTLAAALKLGRSAIGIDLNRDYLALAERRCKEAAAEMALYEPCEITREEYDDA